MDNAKASFLQAWAAQARGDAKMAKDLYARSIALLESACGADRIPSVIWGQWLREVA